MDLKGKFMQVVETVKANPGKTALIVGGVIITGVVVVVALKNQSGCCMGVEELTSLPVEELV